MYNCPHDSIKHIIVVKFVPTLPFWSGLMLGDLSRHGDTYPYVEVGKLASTHSHFTAHRRLSNPPKTNSTAEQRFYVLKHILLKGQKNLRVDDFISKLQRHTIATQKIACAKFFHGNKKRKLSTSAQMVKETWRKKNDMRSPNLSKKCGRYQRPPTIKIPVIHSTPNKTRATGVQGSNASDEDTQKKETAKISGCEPAILKNIGIPNILQNCWLNAGLQAFVNTDAVCELLTRRRELQFDAVQSALVSIFDHLRSKRAPSAMIIKDTLKHLERLNFDYGAQNDAHHFVVKCVCPLLTLVNECQIISTTRVRCEWCVEVSNTVTETHIIIPPTEGSIQDGINVICANTKNADPCSTCGSEMFTEMTLNQCSDLLVVTVGRWDFDKKNQLPIKILEPVVINHDINLNTTNEPGGQYTLKSAIVHLGSYSGGHYTTFRYDDQVMMVFDDSVIRKANAREITELKNNCYVLIYQKTHPQSYFGPSVTLDSLQQIVDKINNENQVGICRVKSADMTVRDLMTIRDNNWLNDIAINAYLSLVQLAVNDVGIVICPSYLYQKVAAKNEKNLDRWMKTYQISKANTVLMPANDGAHWYLICLKMNKKEVHILDSAGLKHKQILSIIPALYSALKKRGLPTPHIGGWKLVDVNDIPRQVNSNDCGAYCLYFGRCIAFGINISAGSINTKYLRNMIMYELVHSSLIPHDCWLKIMLQ